MYSFRYSWSLAFGLFVLAGSGCEESTSTAPIASSGEHVHGHDDHEHGPESLTDAMNELTSMRNTIRDAFAKDDQDGAHGPLHDVGHVLEAIPELAMKEKVTAENQAAIEKSVNDLMDAFGRVDKTMHGQEGSTYAEESATIDAALEALSQACGLASAKAVPAAEETPASDTFVNPAAVEETPAPAADSSESTDEKNEQ